MKIWSLDLKAREHLTEDNDAKDPKGTAYASTL